MRLLSFHDCPDRDAAIRYYHQCWGEEHNYRFFADAIAHSREPAQPGLPRFYFLVEGDTLLGCCGLISAEFISRGDLTPWVCGLHIDPSLRGQGWGGRLLQHAVDEARRLGFDIAYLTTEHDGYYERYGWARMEDGYDLFSGEATRIYRLPADAFA
ncbi:GNAT family N-acetyltransferase [Chitinibacteraceae bacterium HSL-7]